MYYVKWTFWIVVWTITAAFLHYTLPQHDIVRISDTYQTRVDFGLNRWFYANADAGAGANEVNRDVFFISALRENGDTIVYRNEDTGFGWPPYFKNDTADLQAQANDLASTSDAARWVAVRHYGWRIRWISVHPNATAVWPVESPDTRIIPWFNIIFLTGFGMLIWYITARIRRFRENRIDPALEEVQDALRGVGK